MKKIVIGIVGIILLAGGYVVFTLQSGQELDEASPIDTSVRSGFGDALNKMDQATKDNFMQQVDAMANEVMVKSESMPSAGQVIAQGDFMRRFHSVAGRALLIEAGTKKIIRFEDFETDNGPNLHIYLSSSLGDNDFIDLGKIKATKGNVNYEIDAAIDTNRYNKVLVWCVPFRVLFSYAELN